MSSSVNHEALDTEDDWVIRVDGLGKCYQIYDRPSDRLKQMLVRNRRHYFREFWALRDVSFQIKKGETLGIIGRNGSGKSTLLQMICGTLTPTTGSVHVKGKVAALLELGAGFNPEFTGRENVYMAASIYGLSEKETDERFEKISTFADIGDHLDQPVKTYSSGMYVRLAFAVIAHVDADILVIDEALAVGDAVFTQKCMRFIRKFRENGTLLFVSHDNTAVTNLCDSAVWLDRGLLKIHDDAKTVCESYLNMIFEKMSRQDTQKKASPKIKTNERIGFPVERLKDYKQTKISLKKDEGIRVFRFDPDAGAVYGGEDALVTDVSLLDKNNEQMSWVKGGEELKLKVHVLLNKDVSNLIIGFMVKDRLGQSLFGDNTYLATGPNNSFSKGASVTGAFEFVMPWLPRGSYSIQVAAADGTQDEHVQLIWVHDSLIIESHFEAVSTGLIGIPISRITISEAPEE